MAKKLTPAPNWVIRQGLSPYWDPVAGGLKKNYKTFAGYTQTRAGFQPPTAGQLPSGTYDVGLDAQQRAAQRGLRYQVGETYGQPGGTLGGDIGQQVQWSSEDLQQTLDDIARNRRYSQENRDVATAANVRNFQILGRQQGGAARSAGVAGGGALFQAMQKRQANQALAQQPIETEFKRTGEELDVAGPRAQTQFNRQQALATQQAERAALEAGQFGIDIGQAKIQQAKQFQPELFIRPPVKSAAQYNKKKKKKK